ncbi:MAG TPA: ATP-binding protein [Telluria sp.]
MGRPPGKNHDVLRSLAQRTADNALSARERSERNLQEAQEALRTTRERTERMLDALTDGVWMLDPDWRITYLNQRALDLAEPPGLTREALVGKVIWDELPGLRGTVFQSRLEHAAARGETAHFEFFYDAVRRWLEVRAYPSPEGLTMFVSDATQRKHDERALVDSANRLQLALAAGRLGDWSWNGATDRLTLGARAAELFGLPADVALSWEQVRLRIVEEDRDMVRAEFLRAFSERSDLDIECCLERAHGAPLWISVVGRTGSVGDGDARTMSGVVQDISTRKSAEDSLRQNEEVLRALANSIPQLAWMANADGHITWYNERWYEYTGTTAAEMLGWGWQKVHDPSVLPHMLEHWRESLRTGTPFEMEFPLRGADGQFRWFLTRVNPVRDRHGHVVRWFGTNTDVDQVKRVQQALRDESNVLELLNSTGAALASHRDLRSLLQTVTDAATDISGARMGAFFYHGAGTLDMFVVSGVDANEFDNFGHPRATPLFGPSLRGDAIVRVDDVLQDPRYGQNPPNNGLPARHPPVRSYLAVPVRSRSGEVLGSMFFGHPEPGIFSARSERILSGIAAQAAVAIDNTRLYEAAQRAAEERNMMLENERLLRAEAERASQMKDEFLATLSHELRTPLSSILGWAQVLRRGSRGPEDLAKGLQTIERNARAQAQLIEDLLDMSRITSGKVMLDMQTVAAPQFVDAAVETVRPALEARNIRLEKHYEPGAGLIAGDPARLQQVIWNLLSNAIKFTPGDGKVTITIRQAGGHVEIEVRDTGAGIGPEFLPHVFERFRQGDASTTRHHGGLGLGLSIVKHLIEQHGGTVRAESAGEGQGAAFTISLPLAKPHAMAARPDRTPAFARPARAPEMTLRDLSGVHVLVVDDEQDARELIKRILSECHAEVTMAVDAAEALAAIESKRPDLLISDLGMPGVDGFELLARVRALGPERGGDLPALALTAFARSEDRMRALDAGFMAHISKPVEPTELIAAVEALVGGRRG